MKLQKTIKANLSNGRLPLRIVRQMFAFTSFRKRHRGIYETAEKTITRGVFIILFCVCFLPNEARAAVITVNTTSDTIVDGACDNPPTPGCSLRGAMKLANDTTAFDGIVFNFPATDPFCTAGVCTINLTEPLDQIRTDMQITGSGADKLIVRLAPSSSGSVFIVNLLSGGTFTLSDLTVSGGNNSASSGAGIIASTFISVNIVVRRCVISGNSASTGGGIFSKATMTIIDSLITGNTGGGILNSGGDLRIVNSTIAGNTGRGIENANSGIVNLTNSTVSSNSGIGITNTSGSFLVKSSIIARNGSTFFSDINGAFVSAGFNLIGKRDAGTGFTAQTDQTGTILAPLDPKFDPAGLKDNGGATKTITLMSGSPAIDKGSRNGLTGVFPTDQRGSPRLFDDPAVQNASGGDGTDIGALERRKSPFDFDGDGRTDVGVWRAPSGSWWYLQSSDLSGRGFSFGVETDVITPGDYTGDGKTDIGVFRPSTAFWYIQRSEDGSYAGVPFGLPGDIPAPADYDGDGKTDLAVFRPGNQTWFIQQSGGGFGILTFGLNGDRPVPADYDGDGKADIAVWRPSGGTWWIVYSSDFQQRGFGFGTGSDKPVPGDYTGDGKADIALWRDATREWFFLRSDNNFSAYYSYPSGLPGDIPAPGDYDGDGRFDSAVFRASTQTWYVDGTGAGAMILTFGLNGDRPVANAFVP